MLENWALRSKDLTALQEVRGLIIDMDGVLWLGDIPLPGLQEFFQVLRARGLKFVLATNNSTQTPAGFAAKARRLGVEVLPEEIINAAIVTVQYLQNHYSSGSRVYVIGEPALKDLVVDAGFVLADRQAVAVIAAMDRHLTYEMLERATLLIRAGADFIGPNPDPSYAAPQGIVPGSGAVLAALSASADRQPTIIGKPERWIFETCLERLQVAAGQVVCLGDRLSTDIAGGQRMGLKTILVLSGVSTLKDVALSPIQPTWVFQGIDELAQVLSR